MRSIIRTGERSGRRERHRDGRGKVIVGRCSIGTGNGLAPYLRSAFLLGSIYELLRGLGESAPYSTTVDVLTNGKWTRLTQFSSMEDSDDGEVCFAANGPSAAEVCEQLPLFLKKRFENRLFDEDGYVRN